MADRLTATHGLSRLSFGAPSSPPAAAAFSEVHANACAVNAPTRIAMFTNAYPAISHTFIRNEVIALERLGFSVARITVRPSNAGGIDPADRREGKLTQSLLGGGKAALIAAVASRLRKNPRRFFNALRLTIAEPQRTAGRLRNIAYFIEACRLATIAEQAGVQHIHVHFGTNPAAIARLAARLTGIGYSMTVHGPDEFDAPAALHMRAKIADARFVVAISDFGRSQLMRWSSPADWPKIAVVRCGVANSFRGGMGEQGRQSRIFVCVARLSAQKGLPLLIDAAAILASEERFTLRIIGDGELRQELEDQIARLDLGGVVQLAGWMDSDGVRAELLAARAMVLPSFAEGLPIVLMEALALGRPVVATAIAGIPELVDAANGWIVRAGSAPVLADAMRDALNTPDEQLRAMAAVGQDRVRADHDVDRNAAQLAALIRRATTQL